MEVAAGRAGGHPVTPGPARRSFLVLLLVTALLAVVAVVGGFLAYREHDTRSRAATEQERYGAVLAAATQEAEAFINIRYDRAQESIDAVASGATGTFKDQYTSSADSVVQVLKQERSVMDGKVVWAGVVDVDQDSATVIAATSGTVANVQTDNQPVARNFRLRLDLVLEDGVWLTHDLQFVG